MQEPAGHIRPVRTAACSRAPRAGLFHRPGRREEALRLIRAALDRDPDLPSAHNLLGLDAAERRDYPTAERRFLRAVRVAPGRREYELNLSACRNLINRTDVKEGK